jgi:hypothetical protein
MEGINWFDVKRRFYREGHTIWSSFLINGELRNYKYQLINNGADDLEKNTMEAYELVAPTTPVIPTVEKMFLPIPAQEVTANPLLAPGAESIPYVPEN